MQMGDRVILHSDINCCYASIEHLHHPELAGKPLAVGGDPEARHGAFSISTKGYLLMNKIIYNFGKTRAFHGVQGISDFLPSYNLDSIH